MDGQIIRMPGFQAGTEEQYQYPLFMANNLSDGVHDIKVTNSEGSLFELDSVGIVWFSMHIYSENHMHGRFGSNHTFPKLGTLVPVLSTIPPSIFCLERSLGRFLHQRGE